MIKTIIFILMFLISSIYVIAEPDLTDQELFDGLLMQLNFEGNILNETSGRNVECTTIGNPVINTTDGFVDSGITIEDQPTLSMVNCDVGGDQRNYSISIWIKGDIDMDTNAASFFVARKQSGDNEGEWSLRYQDFAGQTDIRLNTHNGVGQLVTESSNVEDTILGGTYLHICAITNQTTNQGYASLYLNGSADPGENPSNPFAYNSVLDNTLNVTIGNFDPASASGWGGQLDEVNYFNISIGSAGCKRMFDLGVAGLRLETAMADVTAPVVTIEAPTPANNSFSTSITQVFNISVVELNLDTITLDLNGTNQTGFVNDFGNFHSLTVNTMAEGLFTYIIYVNDTSANEFVSGTFQFTIDNTSPVITYTIPLLDNSTTITDLTSDIDINGFNINLNIANLTVFNATDFQIFQNTTTGLSTSTFTFVNSFNEILLNQPNGTYKFHTCFVDDVSIETCEDANMTFQGLLIVVEPPRAELPFENIINIVGMVVLLLVILSFVFTRGIRK